MCIYKMFGSKVGMHNVSLDENLLKVGSIWLMWSSYICIQM